MGTLSQKASNMALNRVHYFEGGYNDLEQYEPKGWYFWAEDDATRYGPYKTEQEAKDAYAKYCKEML